MEIENQRLREHLQELNKLAGNTTETEKQELSKSRMNLEKLYEEGFHVCNILYGSRRENDEECAFVLMLFMGNVRVKSSGHCNKGKVWFDSQSIVKSNLYLFIERKGK